MISYDYTITRDEGNEEKIYRPNLIPPSLQDVVYIQGPNSIGKSTLLNILALSFFGLDATHNVLANSLKNRVEKLLDIEHQKIIFKIHIKNELMGVELISEKNDPQTTSFTLRKIVGGKATPISKENFNKEFKLIYDIPDDPLERIKQLLTEIKNSQKITSVHIAYFRDSLRQLIEEINNSKNLEHITKLYKEIEELEQTYENISTSFISKSKTLSLLKQYFITKFLYYYQCEEYSISQSLERFNRKKIAKENKNKRFKGIESYKKDRVNEDMKKAEDLFLLINYLLNIYHDKEDLDHFNNWKNSSLHKEIFHNKYSKTLRTETRYFINKLSKKLDEENYKHSIDINRRELFLKLIDVLNSYQNLKINIPGSNQSITDLQKKLEDEIEKDNSIFVHINNLNNCVTSLSLFLDLINTSIDNVIELQKNTENLQENGTDEQSFEQEILELQDKLFRIQEKVNEYRSLCIKNSIDPGKIDYSLSLLEENKLVLGYKNYQEEDFKLSLDDLEKDVQKLDNQKSKIQEIIQDRRREHERLSKKEPHKYQPYKEVFDKALKSIQRIDRNFSTVYDGYINNLILQKKNNTKLADEENRYSNLVGEFLAKKIGTLRHIDNEYHIKNIDVREEIFLCEGGKVIYYSDLGTGQSQSTYLNTLLSMDENKKIIALFDEVAMMDEKSLAPIKAKMKRLYDEKKLLLGIIVQRGEEVRVDSLL